MKLSLALGMLQFAAGFGPAVRRKDGDSSTPDISSGCEPNTVGPSAGAPMGAASDVPTDFDGYASFFAPSPPTSITGKTWLPMNSAQSLLEAASVKKIIDEHFQGVPRARFLTTPNGATQGSLKPSWHHCSMLEYSSYCFDKAGSYICGEQDEATEETLETLGITDCFDSEGNAVFDNTHGGMCRTITAYLGAMNELTTKLPNGPVMSNHVVVKWSSHTIPNPGNIPARELGPFSSWIPGSMDVTMATETSAGKAEYKAMNNSLGLNGVNGYAICDMVRTVLQQNANQAKRASCAPTAFLSALSHAAPTYLLSQVLYLFYTGYWHTEITGDDGNNKQIAACDHLLAQLPGTVPWDGGCANPNSPDCLAAAALPPQSIGLEWYFTAFVGQAVARYHRKQTCEQLEQTTYALMGPWKTKEQNVAAASYDAMSPTDQVFICKHFVNADEDECNWTGLNCPGNIWSKVSASYTDGRQEAEKDRAQMTCMSDSDGPTVAAQRMDQACKVVEAGGIVVVSVASHIFQFGPGAHGSEEYVGPFNVARDAGAVSTCEVPPLATFDDGKSTLGDLLYGMFSERLYPNANGKLFKCSAFGIPNCKRALLSKNWWRPGGTKNYANPYYNYNHAVSLTQCYEDPVFGMTYVLTTWGAKIRLSKTLALGDTTSQGIMLGIVSATQVKNLPPGPSLEAQCKAITVKAR